MDLRIGIADFHQGDRDLFGSFYELMILSEHQSDCSGSFPRVGGGIVRRGAESCGPLIIRTAIYFLTSMPAERD